MTTILELDKERRTLRGIQFKAALRLRDREACRRIVAEHRAETAAARRPAVGEVFPAGRRRVPLLAETFDRGHGGDAA